MNTKLALAAALVLGALVTTPALARGHRGGHHAGGHPVFHGGGHHGWHGPHGARPRFGFHGGGGWRGGPRHGWGGRPIIVRGGPRVYVDRRPVFVGPRRIFVNRPYPVPVYARPAGYGPGCSTTRRVGFTPWGWRKIVTTRTCIVP